MRNGRKLMEKREEEKPAEKKKKGMKNLINW